MEPVILAQEMVFGFFFLATFRVKEYCGKAPESQWIRFAFFLLIKKGLVFPVSCYYSSADLIDNTMCPFC